MVPRRQFLHFCSIAGIGVLTGCTSDSTGSGSPTGTERPPGTKLAKLTADDGDTSDQFGSSIAVSSDGTTAIVGAHSDENQNGTAAGSAYVFEAADGSWSQRAKLTPDDGGEKDYFGNAAAVSEDGTTALIGAHHDDDPNGTNAGSAYVFEATDGSWTQQAKLSADDGDSEDAFGNAVAVSSDGTTAVVSAHYDDDPNGTNAGSAYIFEAADESWSQRTKLTADDGDSEDGFGRSVAVSNDGTTVLVGATTDEDPNGPKAGSAYVFEATDGSWTQQTKLVADDGESEDGFGRSVAVSSDGTTALIGAVKDDDPDGNPTGSTYVFEATDGSWAQQATLVPDDGERSDLVETNDWFGRSVSVSGDGTTALIGAPNWFEPSEQGKGAAYGFEISGESWTQQVAFAAMLGDDGEETPENPDRPDRFGNAVALSNDGTTGLVCDKWDADGSDGITDVGSAYVFTL